MSFDLPDPHPDLLVRGTYGFEDPVSHPDPYRYLNVTFLSLCLFFLKVHLHHSSKIKVIKKSQNNINQGFFIFLLDDRRIQRLI